MSIGNRQIGWSNESNLLWNISKQLEKLNGVVAATAAGGMLNPTTNYIPFNSGLAFGDSYLVNDTTASVLKTVYSASDVGLKLDFANNQFELGKTNTGGVAVGLNASNNTDYVDIGDYNNTNNGVGLLVDSTNSLIKTYNSGITDIGLKLDFANNEYTFGYDNGGSYPSNYFYTTDGYSEISLGSGSGIRFEDNATVRETVLGDPGGNYNSTTLFVDDFNQTIYTKNNDNTLGLQLDFSNNLYILGDYAAYSSDSYLMVDAGTTVIELGTDLSTTSAAGSNSGNYLKVRIGGVNYKIALLNNA
jgi:hypothetical protein